MTALKNLLQSLLKDHAIRAGRKNVFVAVETIYSMDGDIAPLVEIVRLMKETFTAGNGYLIVDEAHSTGCFGPKGRGIVSELGLEGEVAVKLHTFGKALACNGAILLCSPVIREYLINYARPLIYTTFMSYPALAAIRASYQYLEDGKTEMLAADLKMLIGALHSRLLALQERLDFGTEAAQDEERPRPGELLRVSRECPQSPIFSVLSAEPKSLAAYCQRSGFMVRGIVPPTVPSGAERIRICLHAGNTVPQIESLVECIRRWVLTRRKESHETAPEERARL
ncbi:PLP-dependent transferase [Hortaea werneckii]|nr:PLP-dependent transferase [Hortaea werneckii]KAI6995558.1 PLP-dependent transferase [Hortaea werneckii]KAI7090126.1 PLP-dependent transferase [Hortaea werneckii]KAI7147267.1 PLP-dependent transferase [Hortaea werneckii]KAI7172725.1 PLP-dependent transferase [Hortaea werneckii]